MERRVAPAVGTASDRTSIDLRGSGDPSQPDCVDEATNTTSYLLVLDRHGLIKHHAVDRPLAKDSLTRWTHWAAVIREKESAERFAIDSGTGPNGESPTMQAAASFYVPDSYADNAPPERGLATADANSEAPAQDPGALTRIGKGPALFRRRVTSRHPGHQRPELGDVAFREGEPRLCLAAIGMADRDGVTSRGASSRISRNGRLADRPHHRCSRRARGALRPIAVQGAQ